MADPVYVQARRILIDALDALAAHRAALVVVGAQAIYLRTGDADLAVAPYTTDADLALDPTALADEPLLETAMVAAGFSRSLDQQPGSWSANVTINGQPFDVPVDLLVPSSFAPQGGQRGARLGSHGRTSARKVDGLEACLVDNVLMTIRALDPSDTRAVEVRVAGRTGLLIAKVHKLSDRIESGRANRLDDKDAADVYRLMLVTPASEFSSVVQHLMGDERLEESVSAALERLPRLFGRPAAPGVQMAVRALRTGVPQGRIEEVCAGFVAGIH